MAALNFVIRASRPPRPDRVNMELDRSVIMTCLSVGLTQFSKLTENAKWWNLFHVRRLELSEPCNEFISSYEALKKVISVIYMAPVSFDLSM